MGGSQITSTSATALSPAPASLPLATTSSRPANSTTAVGSTPALKLAESHPLVKELIKRFAADIVRREPLDHAAWLAKLRRDPEHHD
ncbi:MAG: hypothetical protein AAB263_16190 [Planctomycetota bacterium]